MRGSAGKIGYWRAAVGGLSKRSIDLFVATLATMVLAPLFLAVAVLITGLIGRPVIVAERRIGLGGKVFASYVFRTAPATGASIGRCVTMVSDGLTASGLDRLPQLFNILRGDMSLVGPEALKPEDALSHFTDTPELLLARPGLTGMHHYVPNRLRQQVSESDPGRLYVLHWSVWLDLCIAGGALVRVQAQRAIRPAK